MADDVGGAIKGSRIDLAFNSRAEALQFGRQNCKSIYFITIYKLLKGAVTKQPLKFKKLLVDYMKSTNNFFVFLSKKGPEGPFSLV